MHDAKTDRKRKHSEAEVEEDDGDDDTVFMTDSKNEYFDALAFAVVQRKDKTWDHIADISEDAHQRRKFTTVERKLQKPIAGRREEKKQEKKAKGM